MLEYADLKVKYLQCGFRYTYGTATRITRRQPMNATMVSYTISAFNPDLIEGPGPATTQKMQCTFSTMDMFQAKHVYELCGDTISPYTSLCAEPFAMDEQGTVEFPPVTELLPPSSSSKSVEPATSTVESPSTSGSASITEPESAVSEHTVSEAHTISSSTTSGISASADVSSSVPTTTSTTLPVKGFDTSLTNVELAGIVISIVCVITMILVAGMLCCRRRQRLHDFRASEVSADIRFELPTSDPDVFSGLNHQFETETGQSESHTTETGIGKQITHSLSRTHEMPGDMHGLQDNNYFEDIDALAPILKNPSRGCIQAG
jgi:hypothetical protein